MFHEADKSIYVAGLPLTTLRHEVQEFFSQYGALKSLYLSGNVQYKFAFVTFEQASSAEAALASGRFLVFQGTSISVKRRTESTCGGNARERRADEKPRKYCQDQHQHRNRHQHQPEVRQEQKQPQDSSTVRIANPSTSDAHTLYYGTNGDLRLGCETRTSDEPENGNRVIRVDKIPADWTAAALFTHLSSVGLPVVATMVYDDIDERALRQGLIQLSTAQQANRLLQQGYIRTPVLKLDTMTSSVNSIGPVRTSYYGRFTAYGARDLQDQVTNPLQRMFLQPRTSPLAITNPDATYGYSVAEPGEPHCATVGRAPKRSSIGMALPAANIGVTATGGRGVGIFSPHANWSADTTPSAPSCEPPGKTLPVTPPSASRFGQSAQKKFPCPPGQQNGLRISPAFDLSPSSIGGFSPPAFCSIVATHKPSATVVVENFDSMLISNAQTLASSMSQFGQVLCADLVPQLGNTRAYVTFANPLHAELAMAKLSLCLSGQNRLCVRLA